MLGAQRPHAFQDRPNRSLQLQRLGRWLNAQRHAHEQRVVEIAAQPPQRLAQRRLCDIERPRRPRQAVLAQQHVQHLQMMQVGLAFIT